MAAVSLNLGPRGELARMTDQTATGSNALDVEIQPDAACILSLSLQKPTGATTTIKLKRGASGAVTDLKDSASLSAGANIQIDDIELRDGDEVQVDVDTTSGAKTLSAVARRFSA